MTRKIDKSELLKLSQLVEKPIQKARTIGIILDATRPYKTQNSKDFVTKLKIIDDTINCQSPKTLPLKKAYIHIFIFTKTLQEAPNIPRLGDIIYLKRYDFAKFYSNEMKGINNQFSNGKCFIYNGKIGSGFEVVGSSITDMNYADLNKEIEDRIERLREFSFNFFSQHSLTNMAFFGLSVLENNIVKQSDFDLILKIDEKKYKKFDLEEEEEIIENQQSVQYVRYTLKDGQDNLFYLDYLDNPELLIGTLVKIRSITSIDDMKELQINDYTSILAIPEHFQQDQNKFKEFVYQIIKPETDYGILESTSEQNDFNENDNSKFVSYIKNKYTQTTHYQKPSDLKNLIENSRTFQQNTKTEYEYKKYRLQCYVIDVQPSQLKEAIVYLCKTCRKEYSFEFKQIQCCNKDTQQVLSLILSVKDKSTDNLPLIERLYVYSHDQNPYELFPQIDISKINKENYDTYQRYYQLYCDFLFEETGLLSLMDLIVIPLFYGNTMIYRIIDTKIRDIITPILQKENQEKERQANLRLQTEQQQSQSIKEKDQTNIQEQETSQAQSSHQVELSEKNQENMIIEEKNNENEELDLE